MHSAVFALSLSLLLLLLSGVSGARAFDVPACACASTLDCTATSDDVPSGEQNDASGALITQWMPFAELLMTSSLTTTTTTTNEAGDATTLTCKCRCVPSTKLCERVATRCANSGGLPAFRRRDNECYCDCSAVRCAACGADEEEREVLGACCPKCVSIATPQPCSDESLALATGDATCARHELLERDADGCAFCRECSDNDVAVCPQVRCADGTEPRVRRGQCCATCNGDVVECSNVGCEQPDCPEAFWHTPAGECCPRCNGDQCQVVRCAAPQCPTEQQVPADTAAGKCCTTCDDEFCHAVDCMSPTSCPRDRLLPADPTMGRCCDTCTCTAESNALATGDATCRRNELLELDANGCAFCRECSDKDVAVCPRVSCADGTEPRVRRGQCCATCDVVDECALHSCEAPQCDAEYQYTPDGECCPRCTDDYCAQRACPMIACADPEATVPADPSMGKCCPSCNPTLCQRVFCALPACPEEQWLPADPANNICCPSCPNVCDVVDCARPDCPEEQWLAADPDNGKCCPTCPDECSTVFCDELHCPRDTWIQADDECCPSCPEVDCTAVLCARPECAEDTWIEADPTLGECCPRCPDRPTCDDVFCIALACPAGQVPATPTGSCCPKYCVPDCSTMFCIAAIPQCDDDEVVGTPPGSCCPGCVPKPDCADYDEAQCPAVPRQCDDRGTMPSVLANSAEASERCCKTCREPPQCMGRPCPMQCSLSCPTGQERARDACGCELCECCPEVTCANPHRNTATGCLECPCVPINCFVPCEHGTYPNCDGCEECDCIPEQCGGPQDCLLACEHGFKRDENNCELCECAEESRCTSKCPEVRCDNPVMNDATGCAECPPECPVVDCLVPCEHGTYPNCDGCEECDCIPEQCGGRQTCEIACEHGFARDANNCELCECLEKPRCPTPQCPAVPCNNPVLNSDTGCLECRQCAPVLCDLWCGDAGLAKDENGCDICACPTGCEDLDDCPARRRWTPRGEMCQRCAHDKQCPDTCPQVRCAVSVDGECEHGFATDACGCQTCTCAHPKFQPKRAFEWDASCSTLEFSFSRSYARKKLDGRPLWYALYDKKPERLNDLFADAVAHGSLRTSNGGVVAGGVTVSALPGVPPVLQQGDSGTRRYWLCLFASDTPEQLEYEWNESVWPTGCRRTSECVGMLRG